MQPHLQESEAEQCLEPRKQQSGSPVESRDRGCGDHHAPKAGRLLGWRALSIHSRGSASASRAVQQQPGVLSLWHSSSSCIPESHEPAQQQWSLGQHRDIAPSLYKAGFAGESSSSTSVNGSPTASKGNEAHANPMFASNADELHQQQGPEASAGVRAPYGEPREEHSRQPSMRRKSSHNDMLGICNLSQGSSGRDSGNSNASLMAGAEGAQYWDTRIRGAPCPPNNEQVCTRALQLRWNIFVGCPHRCCWQANNCA